MASGRYDDQLWFYRTCDVSTSIDREVRTEVLHPALLPLRLKPKWTTYCSLGDINTFVDFQVVAYSALTWRIRQGHTKPVSEDDAICIKVIMTAARRDASWSGGKSMESICVMILGQIILISLEKLLAS